MKRLIKGGRVIDPSTHRDGDFDILIEDGRIARVAAGITDDAAQIIDARGLFVTPGLIDLHVHLREPGFEYKETIRTGSMAAARGGFTTICAMPNTKPVIDSPEMVAWLVDKAREDAVVHIVPVGAVTRGQIGEEVTDIAGMAAAGAKAISEDGKSVMNAKVYKQAMIEARKAGIVVLAHCEDKNLAGRGALNAGAVAERLGVAGIGSDVEDLIVARDILLSKSTGCPLHLCHCSTAGSVEMVRAAKTAGLRVTAEACPHHFTLTDADIPGDDANYKMNPPLRGAKDRAALIAGLCDNTIDAISTDHAPHHADEKARGIAAAPFGIVGLETALCLAVTELVETGRMRFDDLINHMSCQPAKIIGIDKGTLAEGKAADITIIDPRVSYRIDASKFVSMGKNTPFDGYPVKGRVVMTLVDGEIVYRG